MAEDEITVDEHLLARFVPMSALGAGSLRELSQHAELVSLAPGDTLADELSSTESTYYVVEGSLTVTGGGLPENLPRVLPDGCAAALDASAWPLPPVFRWLAEAGAVPPAELARTFNCGIGMAVITAPEAADAAAAALTAAGETVHRIGEVVARGAGTAPVMLAGMEDT